MFIEYRPTEYIAKQSETRATRNNFHFSCSCYKKNVSIPAMRQSKTLGEQLMNAGQISLTTSVFDYQLSAVGRLMTIKNSVFFLFLVYVRRLY